MAGPVDQQRAWWNTLEAVPQDSLEELKRFGAPPRHVHSCSEPEDGKNAGCPYWDRCDFSWKGTRPHNVGAEQIVVTNFGPASRKKLVTCFNVIHQRDNMEDHEGVVDVVAQEGDDFEFDGTKPVVDPKNPAIVKHEDCTHPIKVPKFKQLADRPEMRNLIRMEEKRLAEQQKKAQKKREEVLGLREQKK